MTLASGWRTRVPAIVVPPDASTATPSKGPGAKLRAGWSELLTRYEWDVFATLTYASGVWAPEKLERDFRRWIFEWQLRTAVERGLCLVITKTKRDGYGRVIRTSRLLKGTWHNSYRKSRAQPVWVLAIEPHESGKLHGHALIKWHPSLPELRRGLGWELWTGHECQDGFSFGWARVEPPLAQENTAAYLAKYIAKGGELVFSDSFDASRLDAA